MAVVPNCSKGHTVKVLESRWLNLACRGLSTNGIVVALARTEKVGKRHGGQKNNDQIQSVVFRFGSGWLICFRVLRK